MVIISIIIMSHSHKNAARALYSVHRYEDIKSNIFLTKSQVKFERAFFEIVRNSVTLDINRLTIAMCTMSL